MHIVVAIRGVELIADAGPIAIDWIRDFINNGISSIPCNTGNAEQGIAARRVGTELITG